MRIVVFSPNDSFTSQTLNALRDDDQVQVVCWASSDDVADRIPVPQGSLGAKIVAAGAGNVLTRTMLRATPFDTGARFWRATKRNSAVQDAVRNADLLISPERDGGYATWCWQRLAARKGRAIPAVAGYPAARTAIERSR